MFESDGKVVRQKEEKYEIPKHLFHPDDVEEITVPPSTELIPDEYEHRDNSKGLVLIFYSKRDVDNEQVIRREFRDQGYNVSDSNVFGLQSRSAVLEALDQVAKGDHKEKSCLIIFFLGMAEEEGKLELDEDPDSSIELRDVWTKFTSNNCPSLRNKPKIFIFQACRKPTAYAFDSKAMTPQGAYSLPSEADILIVYKVTGYHSRAQFIRSLCNKIDKFGQKDDIIGLVTRTHDHKYIRPLIISTMTRKFYVSSSANRGHYHDLHNNQDETIIQLRNWHNEIKRNNEEKRSAPSSKETSQADLPGSKRKKIPKAEKRPPWR
ncbi:hypothetical protein PPYR_13952 [Photinus pyralis]|uniref:Caspase family p20 domain-containing protein n=2 Tax=Photinus pyralis TaxID=7054 RepID=A0A5N4A3W2_PHOPY|nr:caspase-3-like [Photinus pyralis]KAB0791991.1 hypothetical protein PPYR_13952 [Photinus pyralis]